MMGSTNESIPVLRPQLPRASEILKYLEIVDQNRWYTNAGPLTQRLERELANYLNVGPEEVLVVANGTAALMVALMASRARTEDTRYCLMPSWTFAATPAAALCSGLVPVFVDVERATWAITPETVFETLNHLGMGREQVHSVVPVSPFGAPIPVAIWEEFSQETRIPVVIDAAASFDTVTTSRSLRPSQLPLMVSLHATKVFGIGEGALLVSHNTRFVEECRKRINFGFWGTREAQVLGMNAKLSEYSSAVGLAEFDRWGLKRAEWQTVTNEFLAQRDLLAANGISFLPGFGDRWISSYCNVVFDDAEKKIEVQKVLRENSVDTREWWGRGVHMHPAFSQLRGGQLKNTRHLADRTLGLPFYTDLSPQLIRKIIVLLTSI